MALLAALGRVPRAWGARIRAVAWVDRPPEWAVAVLRGAGVAGLGLLLSVLAWLPMLELYPHTQWGDGQFFHKMIESMRVSVTRYHELPLWNPYECGGVPLWDNPQAPTAAPLLWIMLWVGTTRAIEIWYIVHTALGFVCMWLFAHHELRLSVPAKFLAAAVWAFAGVQWHHTTGGGIVWAGFFYFPLMLLLWRRAERDTRAAMGLGAVAAWMMHEGCVYALAHASVLLGAETLTRAWPPRRMLRIAAAGLIVVAVGITLGGSRFLPVADQLRHHSRGLPVEVDWMRWDTLEEIFLRRNHDRPVAGQTYVWTEYADYLGPIVLVLALSGVVLCGLENVWLVALFAIAFAIAAGHFAPYAPWSLLKRHFPFKEMRVPSRFLAWTTVFLAAFAGIALDRLCRSFERRGRTGGATAKAPSSGALASALCGVAFIGVGDMISVETDWCERFFHEAPSVQVEASPRLYYGGPGLAQFIDQPAQNRGRLDCWEEWAFSAGAPLWQGDVPQARSYDSGVTVSNVARTQNTFSFDADAVRPARVLLNGGYDRNWQATVGSVGEWNKELVVDLPAGHHHVRVRYWPRWLDAGLVLTGLGFVATAAAWIWLERRRRL